MKRSTVKIRDAYVKTRAQNVADMRCFWGGSDSLHKVPKGAGQDMTSDDFMDEKSFSETKEPRQDQDQALRRSTRQRRMLEYLNGYVLS